MKLTGCSLLCYGQKMSRSRRWVRTNETSSDAVPNPRHQQGPGSVRVTRSRRNILRGTAQPCVKGQSVYPWDWEWFSKSDAVAGWPLHCELSSKPSGYVAGSDKMKCGSIPHPGDLGPWNGRDHRSRANQFSSGEAAQPRYGASGCWGRRRSDLGRWGPQTDYPGGTMSDQDKIRSKEGCWERAAAAKTHAACGPQR